MAVKKRLIDYILGQIEIEKEGYISYKKVFGKYAFTFDGVIFALVIDNLVYIKVTKAGKDHIGSVVRGLPYKNADPHYIIREDQYSDSAWFSTLVELTVTELTRSKNSPKKSIEEEASEII